MTGKVRSSCHRILGARWEQGEIEFPASILGGSGEFFLAPDFLS